ncbi:MAG: DNA translocase FtsK, partial [Flavisolibacter sp.]|nr:DNA translocase FtsK [Flavisolibacter sp.]
MANKLKKSNVQKPAAEKPEKETTAPKVTGSFKKDKEEKVDLQKLASDERTWKIIGTISLLISVFLFIAFVSYFFTWKEDQDKVLHNDAGFLVENELKVSNLLGRLGAYISHFFIFRGFGVASMLFCTFFFVVGINLLVNRKVFSIWRNLKYVTIGLLIVSVTFGFIFSNSGFPFGGRVGDMISNWLTDFIGVIGTTALLLVVGISYLIWQFNPSFNFSPAASASEDVNKEIPEEDEIDTSVSGPSVNDLYTGKTNEGKGNLLNGDGRLIINPTGGLEDATPFEINERVDTDEADDALTINEPVIEKEIVDDLLHRNAVPHPAEETAATPTTDTEDNFELEIKTPAEKAEEEGGDHKDYSNLPPYEPTLDLRNYKYPKVDLLEAHGSEKIVQDPAELEANKNQIINTLKNYDIHIQKISATVGPTVTLYEIVPAAGVRISRIKNLEDDIALSLAALGIRIIAPIPGKGTIGIEVPNHKKTVVSMKTLLASEKFVHNNFSLPIAIGKKIDNENFIVDLASMPHLLMAGATGQGKSVGLNAILVSLLYKKHPSQLKFVLIDPKKVELSV